MSQTPTLSLVTIALFYAAHMTEGTRKERLLAGARKAVLEDEGRPLSRQKLEENVSALMHRIGTQGAHIANWMPRPFPPNKQRKAWHQGSVDSSWDFLKNPSRILETVNMANQRRDHLLPEDW